MGLAGSATTIPDASDVEYDNSTSGLTAQEVQAAIDELAAVSGVEAAQTFYDSTQYNTTSNGWVTIFDEDFTAIGGGTYLLVVTLEYTNTDKEKRIGHRVRQEGTTISDTRNTVGFDNAFTMYTFHSIITAVTNERIRIDHGQTDDGGTGRTKNIRVSMYKVGA